LPSGYQFSQPAEEPPIVGRGFIEITDVDGAPKKIFIQRAHLEQDAGKNKHDMHPTKTFTDLNRSGVALLEIVTFLDPTNTEENSFITSPSEAEKYLREIRSIARALGVSNANMEEGSMRADVNVSVRPVGEKTFRTRTETKNMVSFKFIKTAIEFEARRQIEIYENGGQVSQDTMHYNQDDGTTSVMRSKEDALDYRYFPDPDLLPLIITDDEIEDVKKTMPELPAARKARYIQMGIAPFDANRIAEDSCLHEFFDAAVGANPARAKIAANWTLGELLANPEYKMNPAHLSELADMILGGEISNKIAKDIFAKMIEIGGNEIGGNEIGGAGFDKTRLAAQPQSPRQIAEKYNMKQSTDTAAIESAINKVLADNADAVAQYKSGKTGLLGFFVGQIMRATGGTANPKIVNEILLASLAQ
jgi:aspartyl-tRNA(Asn)/glutamyl-tRNA(Gln) amidotransferase subunit B